MSLLNPTSDQLFAIAAWILVGSMLVAGVGMILAFLVIAVWAFIKGGGLRFTVGPLAFLIFVAFTLAFTGSLMRIGERGGSYTDVWAWLHA